MPTLTIDNRRVEVPPGTTILDAARQLGIDIPTLCHLAGYEPSTSCLVCVVKIRGQSRMVPSCATVALDGMAVESETPEVRAARRMALELLLSDHLGDCLGPCQLACPLHMDIPLMLRQIRDGNHRAAIATIRRDIALPAVLGRVCGKPCEKSCRRAAADDPVAICSLKAQMAELDLASDHPYSPPCKPDSGRRVAILGAGPCGLSAAYHLAQSGHRVTLFDARPEPGGRLRREFDSTTLPRDLLDAEIAQIIRLGVELRLETLVADKPTFDQIRANHDVVLIACGAAAKDLAASLGLAVTARGVEVPKGTYQTTLDAVFAAGNAIRTAGPVVRSVTDGKQAARAIDAYLNGVPRSHTASPFTVRAGRLPGEEIVRLIQLTDVAQPAPADSPHKDPADPLELARRQAARCLHCDCRGRADCRLKIHAEQYDARPTHYQGDTRRKFTILRAASGLIYEPGKCIDCGLCIQVAARRRDLLGLTFLGRGFDVRVATPFDATLDEALADLAAACAAACPTSALSIPS